MNNPCAVQAICLGSGCLGTLSSRLHIEILPHKIAQFQKLISNIGEMYMGCKRKRGYKMLLSVYLQLPNNKSIDQNGHSDYF